MLKAIFTVASKEIVILVAFVYAREGQCHNSTAKRTTDIHLGSILIHLPTSFGKLTIEDFYEQLGKLYTDQLFDWTDSLSLLTFLLVGRCRPG